MAITWGVIWLILVIIGIIGSIVPMIPWPQLAYIGIIIFHFMAWRPFSLWFLILWFLAIVIVIVADNFLPVLATKKFWGSKYWTWWAIIWTVVGLFFWLWGILFWPFLWAWCWEYYDNRDREKSLRPAIGSFIWIAMGGIIKIGICLALWGYILAELF